MWFRSAETIKRDFLASRSSQPETDFVIECGLPEELATAGLAVRQAIAILGGVDSGYVHAQDLFERDLTHFDFWGSLDTVELILALEDALGVRISDEQAMRIPNPEGDAEVTVADFVRSVLSVIEIASEANDRKEGDSRP